MKLPLYDNNILFNAPHPHSHPLKAKSSLGGKGTFASTTQVNFGIKLDKLYQGWERILWCSPSKRLERRSQAAPAVHVPV